ncbi:MAG: glucokinase [Rhodospirillales bacterium]|nr:glucokinase [Rhodospirillales bacterium]
MVTAIPDIVADVGGTNARFALVHPGTTDVFNTDTLQVRDFGTITDAFRLYMKKQGLSEAVRACVALAGPVEGDQLQLTNGNWAFSKETTRAELRFERLLFINDFKAQAAAIPYLKDDQLVMLGGRAAIDGRSRVIIGPGTGLGVAGAVATGDGYVIVEGEGGHIGLSPTSDREIAVHEKLLQRYGRVSAERIICGPGLRNLYRILQELDGVAAVERTEAQVVAEAVNGESEICREALDIFLAYLGAVAGDLALTFGAFGGVYIAGGIVPRVRDHVKGSQFRSRFEAKGRMAHLVRDIPTYLVMSQDAGLIGAAACLKEVRA